MLTCLIVVWYNPSDANIATLAVLKSICDKICIIDNSVTSHSKNLIRDDNITYIHNKNIGGIAGAFNKGFDFFIENYSNARIYTFDQDTVPPINFFKKMNEFIDNNNAEIACPNFFDINSKTYGKFTKLSRFSFKETDDNKTHFCISSGMYISSNTYRKLGGFNEELVIDHVDTEFALKALINNIPIYYNRDTCLNHAIGSRTKKMVLGITIKPNNHSPIRRYYISRNGTYLALKYFDQAKSYFLLNVLRLMHEYISIFFFEENKRVKFNAMNKGICDAVKGNLGTINDFNLNRNM